MVEKTVKLFNLEHIYFILNKMDSELAKIANKALDKFPIDKLYADLAQAGLRKAGKALADIIEIVAIPLLPLMHARKKYKIYLNDNLVRYEKALQESEEEPIVVPVEIGVPILQKLTYTSNGELADAFIKLLTNASFESSIHQVHPAFITTLSDLSTDEAIILKSLDPRKSIVVLNIDITFMQKDNPQEYAFSKTPFPKLTGLEASLNLHFRQNIDLYLQNLERLGIFTYEEYIALANRDDDYQKLEELYKREIESAKRFAADSTEETGQKAELKISRTSIDVTPFGKEFMKACLPN